MLHWLETSYYPFLLWAFAIYGGVVIFWLILENRSPQSTFAWALALIFLPGLGLAVYLFFGRGWRAFSRENKLMQQALDADGGEVLSSYAAHQREVVEQLVEGDPIAYKRKLLKLVYNNANSALTLRNRLEVLQNAQEKYPRLIADIEQATQSIHMAYYIWGEDKFTQNLKDLLIAKAQQGVEVRILVDAQGVAFSTRYMRALREGGVEIFTYYNYMSPLKFHTLSYRNHRKIAVIDGRIGYLGGMNISQEHLDGGLYFDRWRDTHLRLDGEAVAALQAIFLTSWYNTTQETLHIQDYFPPRDFPFEGAVPVQITSSGPDSQWNAIRQLYFQMITSAEKHLYIQSPFFIPDDSILEALKAAALSGVDVRMMFAPRGTTYAVPYWAANTYFAEMAAAGAKIYLYQAGYFHPKTVNVDSVVCSIGTANMDIRSFSINYEVNAVIYDEATAQKLERDFLNDLKECVEFDLAEYEARNVLLRLRDSVCRIFSPLL